VNIEIGKTNSCLQRTAVSGQENSIAFSPMCGDVDLDFGWHWLMLLNLLVCLVSPMGLLMGVVSFSMPIINGIYK